MCDPSSAKKVNMDRNRQKFNKNSKGGNKKTIWKKKDSKIVAVDHEIEQLKAKYNEVDLTDPGDNTMYCVILLVLRGRVGRVG